MGLHQRGRHSIEDPESPFVIGNYDMNDDGLYDQEDAEWVLLIKFVELFFIISGERLQFILIGFIILALILLAFYIVSWWTSPSGQIKISSIKSTISSEPYSIALFLRLS